MKKPRKQTFVTESSFNFASKQLLFETDSPSDIDLDEKCKPDDPEQTQLFFDTYQGENGKIELSLAVLQ